MSRWSSVLRVPGFAALLTTGSASLAAPTGSLIVISWALAGAYPGIFHGESYSALALALLGLSSTVPTLVAAVFSGTLADRMDRRLLMRGVNLLALAATIVVASLLVAAPTRAIEIPGGNGFYLPLWVLLIYPFWALETTAVTLFRPAFNAALPVVVRRDLLGTANGIVYAAALLLSIGAGLAGSALVAPFGFGAAMLVPIGMFAVTQVSLLFLRQDLSAPPPAAHRTFLADALDGYRYLWSRRDLLELTLAALAINFFSAVAFVELGLYARFSLSITNAVLLGALISAGSLGAAAGSVAINRVAFEHRAGKVLALLVLGQGVTVVVLGLVRTAWVAVPDMFLFGLFPGMYMTVFMATVQATVPNRTLGRVLAADEVGSYGLVPVGQWGGGLLTVALGLPTTYVIAGVGTLGVGLLMALARDLRRLVFEPSAPEELPGPGPPSPAAEPPLA